MSVRIMQLGIDAVSAGNKTEGARLLRIALKSGELTPQFTAVAYLWLAETREDTQHKLSCYNNALTADPGNTDVQQRLAALYSAQLPPAPTPSAPVQPAFPPPPLTPQPQVKSAAAVQPIVGVFGGPNGPGTAFFVAREGLLATTRYVVGGMDRLTVEISNGYQSYGEVVRAFPELDVALMRVQETIGTLLPVTPYPRIPDELPLNVQSYAGSQIKGKQRPSKRVMSPHWISTDFRSLADAGGNPIFDDRNYLTGMMTKNSSRASGYLYGIHINAIRRCIDDYLREMQSGERRGYCPTCGSTSRAIAAGYFYCEICGGVAPQARQFNRYPQDNPFFEVSRIRCNHCGAQVGFAKNGRCLRCGQSPTAPVVATRKD